MMMTIRLPRFLRQHNGFDRALIVIGLAVSMFSFSCSAPTVSGMKSGAGSGATSRGDEGREVFSSRAKGGVVGDESVGAGMWSIVLESFQGSRSAEEAAARLDEIARRSGRGDVAVRRTPRGAAVVAGSWRSPGDPGAQEALWSVRRRLIAGETPFARAFLAPSVESADPGELPELNLAGARLVFGAGAVYTLQIAVYESPDRAEAKRAAERAALQLRREGELAFYYHGSTRSMVTVGVFNDRDIEGSGHPKAPALVVAQDRYPLNLLNGQYPIIEKRPGLADRRQPSTLVRIP